MSYIDFYVVGSIILLLAVGLIEYSIRHSDYSLCKFVIGAIRRKYLSIKDKWDEALGD